MVSVQGFSEFALITRAGRSASVCLTDYSKIDTLGPLHKSDNVASKKCPGPPPNRQRQRDYTVMVSNRATIP